MCASPNRAALSRRLGRHSRGAEEEDEGHEETIPFTLSVGGDGRCGHLAVHAVAAHW